MTWEQKKLLYLRLALAYPGWLMLNYSIQIIPIGVAQTMQNLIPFVVLILSYLFLGETLHKLEIVNMIVSFCGVLFIVIMSSIYKPALDIGDMVEGAPFVLGVIANALSAIFFATCNVVMRSLRNVHHSLVSSFQSSSNFVLSLIGLLIYRLFINPNNFEYNFTAGEVILLMLTGVARTFSMLLVILAYQLDNAGRTASLNFLLIIFGYIQDTLFFGYSMESYEYIGAGIIAMCSVMVFVFKLRL